MSATSVIEHKAIRQAARHRETAIAELRRAARFLNEQADALVTGQPAVAGHRETIADNLRLAQDNLAASHALATFASNIDRAW